MEKLVEMMQLQFQQQWEEMQAQEQAIPRASRKTTGGHEGHASTPYEARSIGAGLTASDLFRHSFFFALWLYFGAVEGLLVAVSHLTRAHAVPDDRQAHVFLPNQSSTVFKLLSNLAAQETPPRESNDLTMDHIVAYMKVQFDSTRFVIRERVKFWTTMQRQRGESIQELAARIRQAAATCDFAPVADPLDEALRTRFICSVNNLGTFLR